MARLRSGLYYAGLWLISLVFFAPIAWIVLASFKTRSDILAVPPKLFFTPTLENYVDLFQRQSLFLQLGNSILLSLGAVVMALGGALSLSDRRLRVGAPKPAKKSAKKSAALQPAE